MLSSRAEKAREILKDYIKQHPDYDWQGVRVGKIRQEDTSMLKHMLEKGFDDLSPILSAIKDMKQQER